MTPLRATLRLQQAPTRLRCFQPTPNRPSFASAPVHLISRAYASTPSESAKSTSSTLAAAQDAQKLVGQAAKLGGQQVSEEARGKVEDVGRDAEEAARAGKQKLQEGSDKVQAAAQTQTQTLKAASPAPALGGGGSGGGSASGDGLVSKLTSLLKWTLILLGGSYALAYHLDSRSAIHRWIAIPLLQLVASPEDAQKLAIKLLSLGVMPRDLGTDDEVLKVELFGKQLSNPIGLAAGFDKQAEAIDGLLNLGWGMVEIGSVTPLAQPGNELPRYFRLENDRAAINRFGFNSDGHQVVLQRLRERLHRWLHSSGTLSDVRVPITSGQAADDILATNPDIGPALLDAAGLPRSTKPGQLLGINLGKNKASSAEDVSDYEVGVQNLGRYADFLVINISSPNTPGLRALQRYQTLTHLLSAVVKARDDLPSPRAPLLVKIAPDLSTQELHDVADAAVSAKIDGLLISNTTVSRPESLKSAAHVVQETGGLSGPPLKPLSLRALQIVRERAGDKLPLIGCGGIASGADALDFARAGASAVELYTSFGYEGVGHPRRIKDELTSLLKANNTTWARSIGAGLPSPTEDRQGKLPTGEKEVQVVGGTQQRLDSARAGIKGELEGLRRALGSPVRQTRAAAFRPDPSDSAYVSLLDKVHAVLSTKDLASHDDELGTGGGTSTNALDVQTRDLNAASAVGSKSNSPTLTKTEALQKDLDEALLDPTFVSAGLPLSDAYSQRPRSRISTRKDAPLPPPASATSLGGAATATAGGAVEKASARTAEAVQKVEAKGGRVKEQVQRGLRETREKVSGTSSASTSSNAHETHAWKEVDSSRRV